MRLPVLMTVVSVYLDLSVDDCRELMDLLGGAERCDDSQRDFLQLIAGKKRAVREKSCVVLNSIILILNCLCSSRYFVMVKPRPM